MTGTNVAQAENLIVPKFSIDDVKFSASESIYKRAQDLFSSGKIVDYLAHRTGYSAVVKGGDDYSVTLSATRIDYGNCTCYMGQNDELCKHILALALYALHENGQIDSNCQPVGRSKLDFADAKQHITAGVRKFRAYSGPSKTWFSYQRGLDVGAGMVIEGVQQLEPSLENAKYLWKLTLRVCKKLSHGGIDDSNGTVGNAVYETIYTIAEMATENEQIRDHAQANFTDDTGFGFEDDLADLLQKQV